MMWSMRVSIIKLTASSRDLLMMHIGALANCPKNVDAKSVSGKSVSGKNVSGTTRGKIFINDDSYNR